MLMEQLSLVYYGYVFDASGYGEAARAYVHALHRAGVELAVVDLARRERQVPDELVASLIGRTVKPDFHLFHGIPPQWAQQAFRLPNAIGMTVWETDQMPWQWRNALNHVLEVWLPCEFNVQTFQNALHRPLFKLPHAILPKHHNGDVPAPNDWLTVGQEDFVFYSIFEWQERKSPQGSLVAFLRAFADKGEKDNVVLLLKTNPGAAAAARQALAQARLHTHSQARVLLRCEAWSEAQIEALHQRGDCYVSLHCGEGWGYPLFEAAQRGKPVIATNYSGPLEYLNPQHHQLVRYSLSAVRQPYIYYHPRMQWAEPDLVHAAELLRQTYDERESNRARASSAARAIAEAYSLEKIGTQARERLWQLLQRHNPPKYERLMQSRRAAQLRPTAPIPGAWYDADYFERGLKSNWQHGYSWRDFGGLFTESARFLTATFPEAESFLDAGCAKGFLVQALRAQGKEGYGFDHSHWALEQAEATVKPYLTCAGVEGVNFDRQFDVLTAFSLLESLTEAQVQQFLTRARQWTRQALLATITTAENDDDHRDDRDLSHITLRSRAWWNEQFLRAGWRQDALHRIVERMCQAHPLPTRAGWQVYVFASS